MLRRMGIATRSTPSRAAVRSSSSPGLETRTTRNPARRNARKRAPRTRQVCECVTPRMIVGGSIVRCGEAWAEKLANSCIGSCGNRNSPQIKEVAKAPMQQFSRKETGINVAFR